VGRIGVAIRDDCGPPQAQGRALAALAARQHGVVSIAQLRALGLSGAGVARRVAAGRLHPVHRGVYAVGHTALGAGGRRLAAVLACGPRAALSHRSAGAAWGLRPTARARIEVSTAQRGRRGPTGIDLHRVRDLPDEDVTVLDAVPVTTVARTLVDLAAVLPGDGLARAVHEAEVLRLLDVAEVQAVLARSAGRRGTGRLRALLAEPAPGPVRSVLEERFLALCRRGGVPVPRTNVWLPVDSGLLQVDAFFAAAGVVVELDGAAAHRTRRAFHADRRRDAALAAQGLVVVRLTWERVTREPHAVLAELRRILTLRDRPGGPHSFRHA
jgi:hypothetical protein